MLNINQRRTTPTAGTTIDTCIQIPGNFKWAEHTEQTEQSTIGAEIATPEVFIDDREHRQSCDNNHTCGRHAGKKVEHFDVGNGPVGRGKKLLEGDHRHTEGISLAKKKSNAYLIN